MHRKHDSPKLIFFANVIVYSHLALWQILLNNKLPIYLLLLLTTIIITIVLSKIYCGGIEVFEAVQIN